MRLLDVIKGKNSKIFWFSNIITIILAYGFAMFNCTIGVDDENIARSLDWRLFETGRFGLNIINSVFNIRYFVPTFYMVTCFLLIVFANHILVNLYRIISKGKFNNIAGCIFSITLLSYPTFAYKFIFEQNLLQFGLIYLCAVLIVYLYYRYMKNIGNSYLSLLSIICLNCFIVFNLETGIVIVLMLVFFMLILNDKINMRDLITPILLSFVSIVLCKGITFVVMKIVGVVLDDYTGNYITYSNSESFMDIFKQLVEVVPKFLGDKLFNSTLYFFYGAISVVALFKYAISKGKKNIFIACLLVLLSLSMLLITGDNNINPRVTLYMPVFFAISSVCLYFVIENSRKIIISICSIVFVILVYNNCLTVNMVNYDAYRMSEYDESMARNIYSDINKNIDYSSSIWNKPTVFIGAGPSFYSNFKGYVKNIGIESIFYHDIASNNIFANETAGFRIYKYFELLGLHVKEGNDILYKKCKPIAENMPVYPKEGYIKETNDAIIVNFGYTSELGSYKSIEDLDIQENKNIKSNIEYIKEDGNIISFKGWVFNKKFPTNACKKEWLIIDDKYKSPYVSPYEYTCANESRLDVTEANDLSKDFEYCGFTGSFDKSKITEDKGDNFKMELMLVYKDVWYKTGITYEFSN